MPTGHFPVRIFRKKIQNLALKKRSYLVVVLTTLPFFPSFIYPYHMCVLIFSIGNVHGPSWDHMCVRVC